MSEPSTHTADGFPVYCTVTRYRGKYYAREIAWPSCKAEVAELRARLAQTGGAS